MEDFLEFPEIERRRFKRVKMGVTVMYRKNAPMDVWISDTQSERQARMFDLSEGGIGILTDINIPVQDVLRVKFALTRGKDSAVNCYGDLELMGQVRYCCLAGENKYRLGIEFIDIKDSVRTQIRNFVNAFEENP
jgi:c-di-GMP-binding flagellar brake protein YcgR